VSIRWLRKAVNTYQINIRRRTDSRNPLAAGPRCVGELTPLPSPARWWGALPPLLALRPSNASTSLSVTLQSVFVSFRRLHPSIWRAVVPNPNPALVPCNADSLAEFFILFSEFFRILRIDILIEKKRFELILVSEDDNSSATVYT